VAARAAGNDGPGPAECIRRGLLELACLTPIHSRALPAAEGLGLVRLALFDLPPGSAVDEGFVGAVYRRLVDLLEKHAGDDREAFKRWLFGGVDNQGGRSPSGRGVVRNSRDSASAGRTSNSSGSRTGTQAAACGS
jgi:hypothetical protein